MISGADFLSNTQWPAQQCEPDCLLHRESPANAEVWKKLHCRRLRHESQHHQSDHSANGHPPDHGPLSSDRSGNAGQILPLRHGAAFADDETGLYGQSHNCLFGLYVQEQEEACLRFDYCFLRSQNACKPSISNGCRKFNILRQSRHKTRKALIWLHFIRSGHKTPARFFCSAKLCFGKAPHEFAKSKFMGSFLYTNRIG